MNEKSILLYPHEVRGVLQGRQTRITRIIRPQPEGVFIWTASSVKECRDSAHYICPYQVGMRLWVRETWAYDEEGRTIYKASDPSPSIRATRWKPSIHMSRFDSRLSLEVTGVRVERVRDIDRQNAKDEGFWPEMNGLERWNGQSYGNAQLAFKAYWQDIHGPSSWAANPWVWVYNFKRGEIRAAEEGV